AREIDVVAAFDVPQARALATVEDHLPLPVDGQVALLPEGDEFGGAGGVVHCALLGRGRTAIVPRRRTNARPGRLPAAGIGHRGPGFGGRQRLALLQQLDGNPVRGAHEGHAAVARRTVDGHAHRLEVGADGVDVVDLEGQVAEVAGAAVVLRRRSV